MPKKTDLSKLSDTALERELTRRRLERLQKKRDERQAQNAHIIEHIEALLAVVSKHTKTSCSDESVRNDYAHGCDRCTLLIIRQTGCMDNDYKLLLSLVKDPIEDAK